MLKWHRPDTNASVRGLFDVNSRVLELHFSWSRNWFLCTDEWLALQTQSSHYTNFIITVFSVCCHKTIPGDNTDNKLDIMKSFHFPCKFLTYAMESQTIDDLVQDCNDSSANTLSCTKPSISYTFLQSNWKCVCLGGVCVCLGECVCVGGGGGVGWGWGGGGGVGGGGGGGWGGWGGGGGGGGGVGGVVVGGGWGGGVGGWWWGVGVGGEVGGGGGGRWWGWGWGVGGWGWGGVVPLRMSTEPHIIIYWLP